MLIIGLTGSIGMGKSTAAARFRTHGIPVFDADAEVHKLYEGPAVAAVTAAFPGTARNGRIDRGKLSAVLMAEPQRFKDLEAIVHPLVREAERVFLDACAASGARMVVLEIPLLLETGADRLVDQVVLVSAPLEVQKARVLIRPGMTEEKFREIVARQASEGIKRKRADFVVDTGGTVEQCERQVDEIVLKLAGMEGRAFERYWS